MSDPVFYKSNILVAGAWYRCVESYEQVVDEMRGAQAMATGEGGMQYPAPIELTVQGQGGEEGETRPTRVAIQVAAIGMVLDLPPGERPEVEIPKPHGGQDGWPV